METIKEGKKPKKDIRKSFATDVLTIVGGTTLAQIIGMATAPFITRIYGADMFGLSALFISLVSTIVTVSCLRYEFTIMLPKRDEDAINLLAVSLLINAVFSLTLAPIMWFFGNDLALMLNAPNLAQYLWLISPMIFLTGTYNAINYWNSRRRQFRRLSTTQVSKAVAIAGTQLGLGYGGYVSEASLIGANLVGQTVATGTLSYQIWRDDSQLLKKSVNRHGMRAGMKEYRDFPIFDLWSGLINVLSLQLPVFILSYYFTATVVGYYSIGLMVLHLPASFIGAAISKVFYQRAAEAYHISMERLSTIAEQVVQRLILIGVFPILLLTVVGDDLFRVVFGSAWSEAGVYAQILSFWILMVFVSNPLSSLLNVMKKMRVMLMFNVILIVVRAGSLVWGGMQGDVYLSLILFSLSGGFAWLGFNYYILRKTQVNIPHLLRSVSKNMLLAATLLIVVVIGRYELHLSPLLMVALSVVTAVIYYSVYANSDADLKAMVLGIFRRKTV